MLPRAFLKTGFECFIYTSLIGYCIKTSALKSVSPPVTFFAEKK